MKKLSVDKVNHIFRNSDAHEVEIFTEVFNRYAAMFGFESDFQVNIDARS